MKQCRTGVVGDEVDLSRRESHSSVWPACHDTKIPSRDGKGLYRAGLVEKPARVGEAQAMHKVEIPSWAVERALARRGRLHPFDDLDPAHSALVVVDLQNGFMAPGQPAEVAQAREIVPNVNRLAWATRAAGGTVVWIQNTITPETERSWSVWFGHFAREDWGPRMRQAFTPGDFGHALYPELDVAGGDLKVHKTRFSALIQGSSDLDALLRARGIDTLIVVGTATNVCCESTARDAMMLNYKVFFVSDANACRTDAEHNATLASLMVMFADVRSTDDMIALLQSRAAPAAAAAE
jgi:ureidoacrylate peracid hydrolase